ncbi:hypothetical protein BS614_26220 [Paenibacillus xylanexedens]|uniref:HAD-IIIC family phosphatase n=1 Tax=Paenibacillus xylanexedens TaxID=528191 RepID=UPI00093830FF|nr:HAD-IIIC family phosphatase [Paenibacillus xylanexedens]APO47202.1 hypothetical protein BS614_26220 [Paenibacillus xylanexedens]
MKPKQIKCLVWDLDNTLWQGILAEDTSVYLIKKAVDLIKDLDQRGVLISIASKNDEDLAMRKLKEFGLSDYFIYPQIHWGSKSESIRIIASELNINLDAIAFIDDQDYELEEVRYALPEVMCIHANQVGTISNLSAFNPKYITEDSKNRRLMYMNDRKRREFEEEMNGPQEQFLSSLNMKLTIGPLNNEDLKRAEELTIRTNQLNSTGNTYDFEELQDMINSKKFIPLIIGLSDRFGDYGKIGLVVIEVKEGKWIIRLMLMSCRVMSRGIGSIIIRILIQEAQLRQVNLLADFVDTGRNRMMYVTYKFAGFSEKNYVDDILILEHNNVTNITLPDYIQIDCQQIGGEHEGA